MPEGEKTTKNNYLEILEIADADRKITVQSTFSYNKT